MKYVMISINVLGGMFLFFFGFPDLSEDGLNHFLNHFEDMVYVGPLFLQDLTTYIFFVVVFIGPVLLFLRLVMGTIFHKMDYRLETVYNEEMFLGYYKHFLLPLILFGLSILFGLITYYNLPSVKTKRFSTELYKVESSLEDIRDSQERYADDPAFLEELSFRERKLKLFQNIYGSQHDFISSPANVKFMRLDRVSIYFGVLSVLLFFDASWLFDKKRLKIMENPPPPSQEFVETVKYLKRIMFMEDLDPSNKVSHAKFIFTNSNLTKFFRDT